MTDKEQIIIDGVEVNECDFFIKNRDKYLCRCIKINSFGDIVNPKNAENSNCLDNYNCYYKQLARNTAECEKLKESQNILIEGYAKRYKKWERFRQAFDELKEICEQLVDDDYIRPVAESLIDIIDNAKEQL